MNKNIGPLATAPQNDIIEITSLPINIKNRYIVAGYVDFDFQHVMLFRGDGMSLIAPMSIFKNTAYLEPDYNNFSITDCGQTLSFGDYEASVDAILYELDPQYKSWADANSMAN